MSAAGQLSASQARYRDLVSAGTGLDPLVVTAWIGSESGWGTVKANHNYLNVGPGESYASVAAAAERVIRLVRNSGHYAGIRSALPAGPRAQAQAIGVSPWDADRYGGDGSRLVAVYDQLAGSGVTTPVFLDAIPDFLKPFSPGGLGDGEWSWTPRAFDLDTRLTAAALTVAFVLGGLVLVVLGLLRMTGVTPRSLIRHSTGGA